MCYTCTLKFAQPSPHSANEASAAQALMRKQGASCSTTARISPEASQTCMQCA